MSAEENKAIVRRYWQILCDLDVDAVEEVISPDYVVESYGQRRPLGVDGIKRFITEVMGHMPEQGGEIEDIGAEGDKVFVRSRSWYRHDMEGRSPWGSVIPPSGKMVSFEEAHVFRIADGKIVEEWYMTDRLAHLQARGAFDALAKQS